MRACHDRGLTGGQSNLAVLLGLTWLAVLIALPTAWLQADDETDGPTVAQSSQADEADVDATGNGGARAAAEPAKPKAKGPKVTRADLGVAYLRLEQALAAHPPAAERVADVNRAFDQATLAFFGGKNAAAVQTINELAASLLPEPPTVAARLAGAIRVKFVPPVLTPNADPPVAELQSLYPVDVDPPQTVRLSLRLRLFDSGGAVDVPFDVAAGPETRVEQTLDLADLADSLSTGTLGVELVTPEGLAIAAGQWVIAGRSFNEVRAENEARLNALTPMTPALQQAVATCRGRNSLLTDTPSEGKTAEFLADPTALSAEVATELAALEAGRDPYFRRGGDYWRIIKTPKAEIPCRVYAPPQAVSDAPAPLVVVLHGAGGDENMFFQGYGAGIIKQLADRHGFLVASPRTEAISARPEHWKLLVEAVGHDYAIDPTRIYVLGHSMGGGATAGIVGREPEGIRAAACLAGFAGFGKKIEKIPPVLAIAAELDPIIPASRIEEGAKKAAERGLPVEYRLQKDYGHTVMVAAVLPEVIEWLLGK